MTVLYKESGVKVQRTILNVPESLTVSEAYLAIKGAEDDADADAAMMKTSSSISNGTGYATVIWNIEPADLSPVAEGEYTWGVKAALSNGVKAICPDSIERIRIVSPFIEV